MHELESAGTLYRRGVRGTAPRGSADVNRVFGCDDERPGDLAQAIVGRPTTATSTTEATGGAPPRLAAKCTLRPPRLIISLT